MVSFKCGFAQHSTNDDKKPRRGRSTLVVVTSRILLLVSSIPTKTLFYPLARIRPFEFGT